MNKHVTAAVVVGTNIASIIEKADVVAEKDKNIGDISKYVGGLSTVFQLVALSARFVLKFAEMNRGEKVLLKLMSPVNLLLQGSPALSSL